MNVLVVAHVVRNFFLSILLFLSICIPFFPLSIILPFVSQLSPSLFSYILVIACCKTIFNATLSQVARIGHLLIVIGLFTFAVIIGQSAPQDINNYNGYSKIELDKGNPISFCLL